MQRRADRLDAGWGALGLGSDEHDLRAGIARAASGIERGRSAGFVGDRDHEDARRSVSAPRAICSGRSSCAQIISSMTQGGPGRSSGSNVTSLSSYRQVILGPLPRTSLAAGAYEVLVQAILTGTLAPGARIR